MQMPLCCRCHKNVAVVFITKLDEGESSNQGYCLKCARELGMRPLDGLMKQMGISEEDMEQLSEEMANFSALIPTGEDEDGEDFSADADAGDEDDEDNADFNRTHTLPFIQRMFSAQKDADDIVPLGGDRAKTSDDKQSEREQKKERKKRKNLTAFCTDLTARARLGKLDAVVGRDKETERVIQILNRRQKNNP